MRGRPHDCGQVRASAGVPAACSTSKCRYSVCRCATADTWARACGGGTHTRDHSCTTGLSRPGGAAPKSSQGHALRSRAKPRSCSGRATAGRAPHPAPRCCRQRRPTSTAAGRRSAPTPGARCLRARRQSTPSAAAPPPGGQLAVRTRRRRRLSPPPACAWHSEGHGLPWARTADDHKARYRRVGGGRLALGVAAAALLRAKGTPVGACARATLVAAEPPAAAGQNREAMASYLWSWLRA